MLLLASAILWSLGGVLIKSIDWTPMAIAGARSLIAALIIGLLVPGVVRKISWQSVPGALAYSATVILFVVATKQTTAANAIFLQYTAPIYIAIISPWLLHERTKWQVANESLMKAIEPVIDNLTLGTIFFPQPAGDCSVEPLETRSQIRSALPRLGAISTAPENATICASTPLRCK